MVSAISRSLSRLSREKLIQLCISWSTSTKNDPYLASNRNTVETEEEDYLHEAAESRKDLKSIYTTLGDTEEAFESLSRKDIVDRILDGDWRRGLTQHQLASIDFANLEENTTYLKWTALKLVPLTNSKNENENGRPTKRRKIQQFQPTPLPHYPEIGVNVFVKNLKEQIAPLVKAHYHVHHIAHVDLSIVRLLISPDTAFAPLSTNVPKQGRTSAAAKTMYIALPNSCPFVYVSVSGAANLEKSGNKSASSNIDIAATKRIVLEAIPKALSRIQQRWSVDSAKLTTRSLQSMSLLRGGGKVGMTGGSFTNLQVPSTVQAKENYEAEDDESTDDHDGNLDERRKLIELRFGPMEGPGHAKLDRVHLKVQSLKKASRKRKFSGDNDNDEPTPISITLSGHDVFAGLKELALLYPDFVDVDKVPNALTGETRNTTIAI